jgi:hypothetical protein
MDKAGELAGVSGGGRDLQLAPPTEIAAPEKVGGADYGGAHGPVFVGALCPGQIVVNPQKEAHQPSSYRSNSGGRLTSRVPRVPKLAARGPAGSCRCFQFPGARWNE